MAEGAQAMAVTTERGTGRLRLSIAMATYNGARFLQEQLDSFTAQTRQPDELVICDDGSSDATMDILHAYAASAPFEVRVVRNEVNLGVVRNFEKAMSLCAGDVIFLSDQDDVWFPEKLACIEREFLADPLLMATTNDAIVTDGDLNHSNVSQLANIRAGGLADRRFIWGSCTAIRRSILQTLYPFHTDPFAHDHWVNCICDALDARRIVETPLQYYRRHGGNESHAFVSSPKRVNFWTVLRQLNLASPLSGWDIQIYMIGLQRDCLVAHRKDYEALGLGDRVDPGLRGLDAEEVDIRARLALLRTPRLRRAPGIFAFWASGRYGRFTGWKSALKDLIRP